MATLYLETLNPLQKMAIYMETGSLLEFYPDVTTFDELFVAGTYEFYAALRAKRSELRNDGIPGNDAELWANLESYDMNVLDWPEGYKTTEGKEDKVCPTTKARLDRAITLEAGGSDQVVSFQWRYFWKDQPTDDGTGHQSANPGTIESQILAAGHLPIVSHAYKASSGAHDGIIVRGYNIASSDVRFTLTWWESGVMRVETVSASDNGGWRNPTWGSQNGRSPLMESVFVPIDFGSLKPNFYIHVRAKILNGPSATARYSIMY